MARRHYYGKFWSSKLGRRYFVVLRFNTKDERDAWLTSSYRDTCDAETALRKGFYEYATFSKTHPEFC